MVSLNKKYSQTLLLNLANHPEKTGLIVFQEDEAWCSSDKAFLIGVLWPSERIPMGVFMRGSGCAPAHRMEVCMKSLSPREAHEFAGRLVVNRRVAVHTRLSQVMNRLAGLATYLHHGNTAKLYPDLATPALSFGIEGLEEDLESFKTRTLCARGSDSWKARIFSPAICTEEEDPKHGDEYDIGFALGESLFTNRPLDTHHEVEDLAIEVNTDEQVESLELHPLPPIYKDKRTTLHVNLGGDFWVEQTRCPRCAQRLIIHAPSSMCPDGQPVGLTVKCGDCKHSFGWP